MTSPCFADANPLSLEDRVEAANGFCGYTENRFTGEQLQGVEVRSMMVTLTGLAHRIRGRISYTSSIQGMKIRMQACRERATGHHPITVPAVQAEWISVHASV